MNYIKEINAFYIKMETEALSTGAVALWHALLHINNRAGWIKRFTVAAAVLCYKTGLSESGFRRARQELREKRLISFESRGTKAPVYEMISCVREEVGDGGYVVVEDHSGNKANMSNQRVVSKEVGCAGKVKVDAGRRESEDVVQEVGGNVNRAVTTVMVEDVAEDVNEDVTEVVNEVAAEVVGTLYKQNNTKQNINKTTTTSSNSRVIFFRSIEFYTEHFKTPSKYVHQQIMKWIEVMGDELVVQALQRTVENGKEWPYTVGILKRWHSQQLLTVEDILQSEQAFRSSRQVPVTARNMSNYGEYRSSYKSTYQAPNVVPDWFRELKEKERRQERERVCR